jgi:hypothetical protein
MLVIDGQNYIYSKPLQLIEDVLQKENRVTKLRKIEISNLEINSKCLDILLQYSQSLLELKISQGNLMVGDCITIARDWRLMQVRELNLSCNPITI